MSDENNIYFGFPNPNGDVRDALHAAMSVTECLQAFINNAHDMAFFDRGCRPCLAQCQEILGSSPRKTMGGRQNGRT